MPDASQGATGCVPEVAPPGRVARPLSCVPAAPGGMVRMHRQAYPVSRGSACKRVGNPLPTADELADRLYRGNPSRPMLPDTVQVGDMTRRAFAGVVPALVRSFPVNVPLIAVPSA